MTSAGHFVKHLRERGVEWMATLCGHGLNPLFDEASRAGIRLIDTRNEQTASYIADYWGKLTGRAGVCCVSSGVAHANALTGVTNAWFDRSPMLLVSGAGALRTSGMGHFQDMDQVSMARPVTKYCRVLDSADRTVQILEEALAEAESSPRAPVHLTYPLDIQTTPVRKPIPPARVHKAASQPRTADVERALHKAKRPLMICGSEVFYQGAGDAMLDFAAANGIPLVIPIWDRGFVSSPHPAYCGVIGAATGGASLLADADVLLLAGAANDYRVRFLNHPRQKAVAVDDFAGLSECRTPGFGDWLKEARSRVSSHRERILANRKGETLGAADVIGAIEPVLTAETSLLVDGGSIGQWAHQLLCTGRYPGHWLTCGRSGVVGWGLGGAMAARLARPQAPVILLSGDGAFTFTVAEIECAVRQKLPFVAVVADDEAWGITRVGHEQEYSKAIASVLGPVAFDRLAESLGARGRRAATPQALTRELRKALDSETVTVIQVPITGGNP